MADLSVGDAESSPSVDKVSLFDRLFSESSNQQTPPTPSGFVQTPFGLSMEQFRAAGKSFLPGEGMFSLLMPMVTVLVYI